MFKRQSFTQPVDYLRKGMERRKLTNYLRSGSCKRLSGSFSVGNETYAGRIGLYAAAAILLAIGAFHALF